MRPDGSLREGGQWELLDGKNSGCQCWWSGKRSLNLEIVSGEVEEMYGYGRVKGFDCGKMEWIGDGSIKSVHVFS